MLESLMRPIPTGRSKTNSPSLHGSPKRGSPKKQNENATKIPELEELQTQIIKHKPNNIILFIKDWANAKLNKSSKLNNFGDGQQEDDDMLLPKNYERKRRNAQCIHNLIYEQIQGPPVKYEKLEETKSIILIIMKRMQIFKNLSDKLLWQIVEQFQEKQYQAQEVILNRGELIKNFCIITSGSVIHKIPNRKPYILSEGCQFGEHSLLFERISQADYASQSITKISQMEGKRITKLIRQFNKEKYQTIFRAILNIEYFNVLNDDEIDKIAQIGLNQQPIFTQQGEEINMENFSNSFLIVLQGTFNAYLRKLIEGLKKEPSRAYKRGQAFGVECLYDSEAQYMIKNKEQGVIVEIKCYQIEKLLGPLQKLRKRRKGRK